jgi:hypothetical protein
VQYEWNLSAACGYAELGMARESLAELDAIPARFQDRPEVLQLRLHHLMRQKKWSLALRVSKKLCRVAPDAVRVSSCWLLSPSTWQTAEAKMTLIAGPVALLKEPIYYYNMGCYEALLGMFATRMRIFKSALRWIVLSARWQRKILILKPCTQ